MNRRGFTLVELIVTLTIVAIMAAFLVPTGLGFLEQKRADQCENNRKAMISYYNAARIYDTELTLADFLKQVAEHPVEAYYNGKNMSTAERQTYEKNLDEAAKLTCPSSGEAYTAGANSYNLHCPTHNEDTSAMPEGDSAGMAIQPPGD